MKNEWKKLNKNNLSIIMLCFYYSKQSIVSLLPIPQCSNVLIWNSKNKNKKKLSNAPRICTCDCNSYHSFIIRLLQILHVSLFHSWVTVMNRSKSDCVEVWTSSVQLAAYITPRALLYAQQNAYLHARVRFFWLFLHRLSWTKNSNNLFFNICPSSCHSRSKLSRLWWWLGGNADPKIHPSGERSGGQQAGQ